MDVDLSPDAQKNQNKLAKVIQELWARMETDQWGKVIEKLTQRLYVPFPLEILS